MAVFERAVQGIARDTEEGGKEHPWLQTTRTRAPDVPPPREEADRQAVQRAAEDPAGHPVAEHPEARAHSAPEELPERREAALQARPRIAKREKNQHSNGLSTGILRFAWSCCWQSLRFSSS